MQPYGFKLRFTSWCSAGDEELDLAVIQIEPRMEGLWDALERVNNSVANYEAMVSDLLLCGACAAGGKPILHAELLNLDYTR